MLSSSPPPTVGGDGIEELRPPRLDRPRRALPTPDQVVHELAVTPQISTEIWWRRLLRMGPSAMEVERANDVALARHRGSHDCTTIMIAQPKGGAGKTPTALGIAGALGTVRGGGVIAWDNNETRGTLADQVRTTCPYDVTDLLRNYSWLTRSGARFSDVQRNLAHQDAGQYWTLASGRVGGRQISGDDFARVWQLLHTYVDVLVIDTGNNESASNWLATAQVADVLVVPCKWKLNSLTAAAAMLHTVREIRPELLDRTVIVGTNGPGEAEPDAQAKGRRMFGEFPICEIPSDPAIWSGSAMDWDVLQPDTQAAYTALSAAINTVLYAPRS